MDAIRATPYRSPVAGGINDLLGGLLGYMRDPRRTQQMQGLAGLLESTGVPKTVERLAYGEPLTNLQQANIPALRPETANALMTLLPVPSGANRAAMAAGRAGERMAERVVPQVMERGGVPAGLLDALSQRTASKVAQSEKPVEGLLDTSYRMTHTAPNREFGATLDDLTGGGQMYPADIYSPKGYQYYGTGNLFDKKAFDIANRFKGKPDATVEIYRAVPEGVSDEINPGDWVTLTKDYAEEHGQGPLKGDYKIIKKKVKASDIYTNADSIHEWGYDPQ